MCHTFYTMCNTLALSLSFSLSLSYVMYTKTEKEETEKKRKSDSLWSSLCSICLSYFFSLFFFFFLCLSLCVWRESKKKSRRSSLSLSLSFSLAGRVLEQRQVVRQSSYEKKISARVAGRCETSSRIQMIRLELETLRHATAFDFPLGSCDGKYFSDL